jgi:hypothetical protein
MDGKHHVTHARQELSTFSRASFRRNEQIQALMASGALRDILSNAAPELVQCIDDLRLWLIGNDYPRNSLAACW